MEEWKDININYKVSTKGRIYSEKSKKYLKPDVVGKGYLKVDLYDNGKRTPKLVHKLVAEAFIINDNPDAKTEINHKDKDKKNNNVENLEWCDRKYNNSYSKIQETMTENKKKHVYQYTLDGELVAIYESVRECENNTGFNQSAISRCCNGGYYSISRGKWVNINQYKGFKWSFNPI